MTKHLFLTSEIRHVASSIGPKLSNNIKANAVYIITSLSDRVHSDLNWHYECKAKMEDQGFHFDMYDLTNKSHQQIESDLGKYSAIYVEGGNSYYLLQESQKSGFINFVTKWVNAGMVYLGTSAGSVIAGPDIEPVRQASRAALAPELKGTIGYQLVNFVVMPHWGQDKRRDLFTQYRLNHIYNKDYSYIFLSDNQYVEVVDNSFSIVTV